MSSRFLPPLLRSLLLGLLLIPVWGLASTSNSEDNAMSTSQTALSERQQALIPVAALGAAGDLEALKDALNAALDAGMTIHDGKEVLVQLYAYAGFPRSLNALGTYMQVIEARREAGIEDEVGRAPEAPIPQGDELLAQGTANQTELVGQPVEGALFDFAPAADEFLKTHLFGDIFARDNLSWKDREIATLGMLAALPGAEPQFRAHLGIGMNSGLSTDELKQLVEVLHERVNAETGQRAQGVLENYLEQ
ncbi:carboxymuconolactone decarboxylase family protein [Marinospirillum perlucidum]|uniref:carboxymuconolactone decarboxylase family protein n=1 Tax=Marinospirillum perlucidum TaxID=1982602 RepID=UPI001C49A3B1|nr:carboxymuconolactone decarboxylase family protein [Marinospirillum perlucidum]